VKSETQIKGRYITIRITREVEEQLKRSAERNTRTMAAQALHYIKEGLVSEIRRGGGRDA
jgi:predicted DNA-binding protein